MANTRQEKLKEKLCENLGNISKSAQEVGYSESYALSGQIQKTKHHNDFIRMLDEKRKLALSHISEEKINKSSARDLAGIADTLTKNHELLSGKPTERKESYEYTDDQSKRVAKEMLDE